MRGDMFKAIENYCLVIVFLCCAIGVLFPAYLLLLAGISGFAALISIINIVRIIELIKILNQGK